MSKFEPSISIVVPVRNADRTLATTFEYLLNIDYPRNKLEILIADGGSSDKTVEITKEFMKKYDFIKLIEIPNCKSPGHARNAALKAYKGDYVLFTDGDCAPEKDWAYQIVAPFEKDKKIGGVGGEVLTLRVDPNNVTEYYCEQVRFLSPTGRCGAKVSGYMPTIKDWLPHEVNGGDNSPFFATANFAVSREAIEKIGGEFWDEPTGEDVDFSLRIMAAGFVLYYQKEAMLKHMHRVDLKSFRKQWYGYGYGHPLLINKHTQKNVLEFIIQIGKPGISFHIPWPKKGIIHIGNYHCMHFCFYSSIITILLTLLLNLMQKHLHLASLIGDLAILSVFGLVWFTLLYFRSVLTLKPLSKFFTYARIRHATNAAFIKGAKDGQSKFNAICIEPSW